MTGKPYVWSAGEQDKVQLNGLRLHWDEWYEITVTDGIWSATRLDDPVCLPNRRLSA